MQPLLDVLLVKTFDLGITSEFALTLYYHALQQCYCSHGVPKLLDISFSSWIQDFTAQRVII